MKTFNIRLREIDRLDMCFYDGIKFYIPIHGKIEALVSNKKYIVNEGELLILNPFEVGVLFPNIKNLDNVVFELEIPCDYISNENLEDVYFFNYISSRYMDTLILDNIAEIYDSYEVNEILSMASLSTFLSKIKNNKFMVKKKKDRNGYFNLKLFYDRYIEDRAFADLTLADISKEISISSSYFSNLFKETTGISLGTFKQKIKLETASDLLLDTDDNLDKISYNIGYQSTKSLYDIFLKHLGILPSEYRIRLKGIEKMSYQQLESKYIYSEFKNKSSNINYQELYNNYPAYNSYSIEDGRKKRDLKWRGISIYSLNKLGESYYENIKTLEEDMGISFIVIDLNLDPDREDLLYVKNLKKYLNFKDVISLMELLYRLDIKVGFSVGIQGKNLMDYRDKDYELIENFICRLLKMATRNVLIDYEWIIDINTVYSENIVVNYFTRMEEILVKDLGEKINMSLFLGYSSNDELLAMSNLIASTNVFDRVKIVYFNYIFDENIVIEYLNYDKYMNYNHRKFFSDFFNKLDKLTKKVEFILCDLKIMYYSEHFKELPDSVYQYSDLKMCFLDAENILNIKTDKLVYFEFFNTYNKLSKKTELIRGDKFKTCNYFNFLLLKKIEGELLLDKPGIIASKNNLDYHLYFYNNLFLDNIFSSRKRYEHLELYPRTIDVRIEGMKGTYKKSTWTIDLFNGNVLRLLEDLKTDYLLTDSEIDYIDRVNYPKKTVDIVHVDKGVYEEKIEITPYALKLVSYHKL